MQVFAWRDNGSELIRVPKRPGVPWLSADLEGIPQRREGARAIFDALIRPAGERDPFRPFRVGVLSDLSPAMGVYRQGQAELSRVTLSDRVIVTCVRGFWAQIHLIWRSNSVDNARTVAQQLIERGRTARLDGANLELRLAGRGELRTAPYVVYVLTGHNVLTGLDAVKLDRSIDAPDGKAGRRDPSIDGTAGQLAQLEGNEGGR